MLTISAVIRTVREIIVLILLLHIWLCLKSQCRFYFSQKSRYNKHFCSLAFICISYVLIDVSDRLILTSNSTQRSASGDKIRRTPKIFRNLICSRCWNDTLVKARLARNGRRAQRFFFKTSYSKNTIHVNLPFCCSCSTKFQRSPSTALNYVYLWIFVLFHFRHYFIRFSPKPCIIAYSVSTI